MHMTSSSSNLQRMSCTNSCQSSRPCDQETTGSGDENGRQLVKISASVLTLLTVRHVQREMDSKIEHAPNNKINKLIKNWTCSRWPWGSLVGFFEFLRVLVCFKVEIYWGFFGQYSKEKSSYQYFLKFRKKNFYRDHKLCKCRSDCHTRSIIIPLLFSNHPDTGQCRIQTLK